MNTQTNYQGKSKIIVLSILSGVGMIVLSLIVGTILDYVIVQIFSQYFLTDCSEDCYFAYFNAIFFVVVLLSLFAGFATGRRTYRRLSEGV
jgi:hypothetical protein